MARVKFTSDFATKRIGDVCEYDGMLASQLVNNDKVAEYTDEPLSKSEEVREPIEVPSEVEYKPANEAVTDKEDEDEDDEGDGMILNLENQAQDEKSEPEATETEANDKEPAAENPTEEAKTETKTEAKAPVKESGKAKAPKSEK